MNHLCSGEEDIIRYVAHTTGDDTQSHSWEHVGVVSLSGVEGTTIGQRHLVEWTSAGKDASALIIGMMMMMMMMLTTTAALEHLLQNY